MTALPSEAGLRLVLGSASPRRRELLAQVGLVPHDIRPPEIDESPLPDELPRDYVNRIARAKAEAVTLDDREVLLCADTTVALGRRIMGKPGDDGEARAFLERLSGRRHKVITAVAVRRGSRSWQNDSVTTVSFKRLTELEISGYLATNDWQGKAGGYAIQGPAGAFVPQINGSFTGVVGLPLSIALGLLQAAGLPIWGQP